MKKNILIDFIELMETDFSNEKKVSFLIYLKNGKKYEWSCKTNEIKNIIYKDEYILHKGIKINNNRKLSCLIKIDEISSITF